MITQQLPMSKTMEEGILGVNGTSNQTVVQQFSRALPGVDLNFQRSGFVLQDRTIICWLNWLVAGSSEKRKELEV